MVLFVFVHPPEVSSQNEEGTNALCSSKLFADCLDMALRLSDGMITGTGNVRLKQAQTEGLRSVHKLNKFGETEL